MLIILSASCTSTPIIVENVPTSAATAYIEPTETAVTKTSTPTATSTPTFTSTPPPPPSPTPTPPPPTATIMSQGRVEEIGRSFENRPILTHQFKDGPIRIILVGGIHGGYEWNTILLAYKFIDYFQEHPDKIPDSVSLQIIPSANPDGQHLVTQAEGVFEASAVIADTRAGRFNGNGVDLNRNWGGNWSEDAFWGGQSVDPGEAPFSEPETRVLRDFFFRNDQPRPHLVIFLHSAADGVYAAGIPDAYPPALILAQIYATASGYPIYENFDNYTITGDAGDWLATQEIPSIAVELKNHQDFDWEENKNGLFSIFDTVQR